MALRISSALIVALAQLLLLSHAVYTSFAASAGRMGGSSFESSTTSRSKQSKHYHHHRSATVYNNYNTQPSTTPPPIKNYSKAEDISIWPGVCLATLVVGGVALVQYLNNKGAVLRVQVGLFGKARSLQRDLNAIATTTDTTSSKGWNHILTETTLALLRHPDYYISGYSSVDKKSSIADLEKRFKQLSSEEREKFDIESLVNVNHNKLQRAVIPNTKVSKDCMVVTILVAANGVYKLPAIRSTENLNEALRYLSDISSSKIMGVEVQWTPQDENDSLSAEELLENYPLLRPI